MLSYCIITTCSLKLLLQDIALVRYSGSLSSPTLTKLIGFVWLNHLNSLDVYPLSLFEGVLSFPLKQARLWSERLNLIAESDLVATLGYKLFSVIPPFFIYNN